MEEGLVKLIFTSVAIVSITLVTYVYYKIWWKPEKIREKLRKQGIRGPPPSFLYGNMLDIKRSQSQMAKREHNVDEEQKVLHDCMSNVFPYFERWRKEHGPNFVYSAGQIPILYVSDPDIVKEMTLCSSLDFGKPSYLIRDRRALFGEGVITTNGSVWARQRKIIASQLYMDKIKGMVGLVVESTISLLRVWERRIETKGGMLDMRVDEDLRNFSADVISRACFGSSYVQGKEIFQKIRLLQQTMSVHVGVPGLRYLPTKSNRTIWRLEREIQTSILKVVKQRQEKTLVNGCEKDLLQILLEEAKNYSEMGDSDAKTFIVDNCKNIYFTGHETTATAASWVLILLSVNPQWQDRVRAEVLDVCGRDLPNLDIIRQMKLLTMVINEALRLYPPGAFVSREALRDMDFGGIGIPKGTNVWVSVMALHRDVDIWGSDASEFNPERFASGISKACKAPHAYAPFGLGIRTCLGMNFAMVELKILLSLLLSKFSFSLSPNYRHSPAFRMLLEPGNGVYLVFKML